MKRVPKAASSYMNGFLKAVAKNIKNSVKNRLPTGFWKPMHVATRTLS
jgi:hypothetical protein